MLPDGQIDVSLGQVAWEEGGRECGHMAALREAGLLDEVIQRKEGLVLYPADIDVE